MRVEPFAAKHAGLGLFLLFAAAYLLPLGIRPLGIPDEMRYAEIPREMLASGGYVSPRLNGLRYFEKPVLGYWVAAASMKYLGENAFAVRLPYALATGFSALGLLLVVRREKGDRLALLSAFLFLCSGLVYFVGTYAVLDSLFSGFVALALCCFFGATRSGAERSRWMLLLTAGFFAGAAFLAKGFIALAVPVLVVVPYLLWEGRWRDLLRLPWLPLVGALAVALPWCIAIARREPDFWNYFFWQEHINRFFSHAHAQHRQPFWFFIPVLLGGFAPWVLVAPLPLKTAFRRRLHDPLFRFALLWTVMPFLFFSASSGKLGTYILPCFPGLAILLAMGLDDLLEQDRAKYARALDIGIAVFGVPVGALALALPVAAIGFADWLCPFDPHMVVRLGAGFLLAIAVLGILFAAWHSKGWNKTLGLGLGAMLLCAGTQAIAPMGVCADTGIETFLESNRPWVGPGTVVVGEVHTAAALCYVFKRSDVYIYRHCGELGYGLDHPGSQHRFLDAERFLTLLAGRGDRRLVVAIKAKYAQPLKDLPPQPAFEQEWNGIWFAVYEPVLQARVSHK